MISQHQKREYYQALLEKNAEYEGIFFVGVKTTGVFCRPTCPARKPKLINCEFFETSEQALLANFRPCKRCKPLSHPQHISELVQSLVEKISLNPEKRWTEKDFKEIEVDVSTVRRQFKKRFGITFFAYVRQQRMRIALKQIKAGEAIIEAQLTSGYESSSGFREAFTRLMGTAPTKLTHHILHAHWLDSPLGPMIALADEKALYLLEFFNRKNLKQVIQTLCQQTKSKIINGKTSPITLIEKELTLYFQGLLYDFETPLGIIGTAFQKKVWNALQTIPYGQTQSYSNLAKLIGHPSAFRAVAKANSTNHLALIIPCHRVINQNGNLGGYAAGIKHKKWLLEHEKRYAKCLNN